uniref:Uncharacterized protein n=1 Tax=Octopus bimaculoides TaxID=37653 RepID=A0A0L8I9N8_OCTBM
MNNFTAIVTHTKEQDAVLFIDNKVYANIPEINGGNHCKDSFVQHEVTSHSNCFVKSNSYRLYEPTMKYSPNQTRICQHHCEVFIRRENNILQTVKRHLHNEYSFAIASQSRSIKHIAEKLIAYRRKQKSGSQTSVEIISSAAKKFS